MASYFKTKTVMAKLEKANLFDGAVSGNYKLCVNKNSSDDLCYISLEDLRPFRGAEFPRTIKEAIEFMA